MIHLSLSLSLSLSVELVSQWTTWRINLLHPFFFRALRLWVNAVSVDITSIGSRRDGHEEGEKEEDFNRAIQYWLLPNESEAYSTSNESIRAQDSLIHVYVFIHESHVPRTVRRKNEYTLKEDSAVYTEFWEREKNRWKPMDTEKARKPENKIAESETRMELKAWSDEK